MSTTTLAPASPATTAPEPNWRERTGPAGSPQDIDQDQRQGTAMPWLLLVGAIALSLGSNVFAVLQIGTASRSFGGVIYGAWPTCAFLAAAWLWHREGRRGHQRRGWGRAFLVWVLRLAVAVPAAYVSLLHVHATAMHFGQPGAMSWAEAIGMEAVTALALFELDASHAAIRDPRIHSAEQEQEQAVTKRAAILESVELDRLAGQSRSAKAYAELHDVSRQYVSKILREATA